MAQILSGWCQSGWLGHSKAASWEESRPSSNANAVWIDRGRWIFRCTSFTWTIDFQVSAVQITSKSHMYPAQIIYQPSFVVLFAVPVLVAYVLVDWMGSKQYLRNPLNIVGWIQTLCELHSIQWCWFDLLLMDVIKFTWGNPLNNFLGWINQPWLLNPHVWCFTCIPGRLHTQFFGFLHHWNCFPIIGNFEDGATASPGRQGRGFGLGDVCDRNFRVENVGSINFLGAIYIYIYLCIFLSTYIHIYITIQ